MLLTEYVHLTLPMVRNQIRLVDECGYCIHWNGDFVVYNNISHLENEIRSQLINFVSDGSVVEDISIDEALRIYNEE